ncbi:hypothetical protein GF312_11750 [Candidatus Poribacteria bacterium]|nr:hypothetical protein [Candidatus Poribacteria bacterium]
MLKYIFYVLLILWFADPALCAFEDDFLGAKSVAMGGAYAATADDVDGILANPAGMNLIKNRQIIATAAAMYVGLTDESPISQSILGYAHKHDGVGTMGLLWKRFDAGGLYSENILCLAIARPFLFSLKRNEDENKEEDRRKNLFLGLAINLMNWDSAPTIGTDGQVVEDLAGWSGFGFDLGITVWPSDNIPVALVLENINTPNIASELSQVIEELPLSTRMGVAAIGESITWAMDLGLQEGQVDMKAGIEKRYKSNLILRTGFSLENLAWGTNLTFGVSYKPDESVRIDYAFVYPVNSVAGTLGSHRISFVYDF